MREYYTYIAECCRTFSDYAKHGVHQYFLNKNENKF